MFESWYLGQKLINIGENLVLEVIPAYLLELKKKRLKKKKKRKERKKNREIRPDAKALAKIKERNKEQDYSAQGRK